MSLLGTRQTGKPGMLYFPAEKNALGRLSDLVSKMTQNDLNLAFQLVKYTPAVGRTAQGRQGSPHKGVLKGSEPSWLDSPNSWGDPRPSRGLGTRVLQLPGNLPVLQEGEEPKSSLFGGKRHLRSQG